MNTYLLLCILLELIGIVSTQQTCQDKYRIFPDHSACQPASPFASLSGVTDADKLDIVSIHNDFRSKVSPPATNMQKMVWDDELAAIAQSWANTCRNQHDLPEARGVPGSYSYVGQNLAAGYATWRDAITAWHDEVQDFTYGQPPPSGKAVGHYTQVVWATSSRVGCGFARCSNLVFGSSYVCNYAPGGNLASFSDPNAQYKPYDISGPSCTACQNSCNNSLCDCGGKVCLNSGTLDPDTCQCACSKVFHDPDTCGLRCSTAGDGFCQSITVGGFPSSDCNQWFVQDECPIMCSVCPTGGMEYGQDTTIGATTSTSSVPPTSHISTTIPPQTTTLHGNPTDLVTPTETRNTEDITSSNLGTTTPMSETEPTVTMTTDHVTTKPTEIYTPSEQGLHGTSETTSMIKTTLEPPVCTGPRICSELEIRSQRDVNITGKYTLTSFVNLRPAYQRKSEDGSEALMLYYRTSNCSYWAVTPAGNRGHVYAFNPSTSGSVLTFKGIWRYYYIDANVSLEDRTMNVECLSYIT